MRSRAVEPHQRRARGAGRRAAAGPQDLDALARDWRDTEPVVTLLARLSDPARRGGPSTGGGRSRPARREGRGATRFMAFKFDDACGQRQLAFLTEAQREAWRTPRALVRVGGAERPDNQPRLKD